MSAATLTVDMPAGESVPAWIGPIALALGAGCWLVAAQLFVGAPTREPSPPAPAIAALPAPTPVLVATPTPAPAAAVSVGTCAPALAFAFPQGDAHLDVDARKRLAAIVEFAAAHPREAIAVEGYASAEGGPEINLRLSHDRAEAVAALLRSRGIADDRLLVQAYGEYRPSLGARGRDGDRRVIVRFPERTDCPEESGP